MTTNSFTRLLRRSGIPVHYSESASGREGVRVRSNVLNDGVSIFVDIDGPSAHKRMVDALREVLTSLGMTLETTDSPDIFRVKFPNTTPPSA